MTRALDALVATHVFGLDVAVLPEHKWSAPQECERTYPIGYGEYYSCLSETAKECHRCSADYCLGSCDVFTPPTCAPMVRPYSSDISAAFAVVETLRAKTAMVSINDDNLPLGEDESVLPHWNVTFDFGNLAKPDVGQATSASLPEAICLAALRALGVESSVIEKARSA